MKKLNRLYNLILNEDTANEFDYINEIDWEDDFSDVHENCISPEVVVDYLNRVKANYGKHTKDREKFKTSEPYFHANSKHFGKGPNIDIDEFIKNITTPPNSFIGKNDKMTKSGNKNEYVYNTGVPALRGLVYDIDNQTFHYVNTCPGAGSCAIICYARKGNYIRWSNSYDNMTRRLNYLMNYPEKYEDGLYNDIVKKCKEYRAFKGYKNKLILRWNDSGDFFSKRYVKIAENVIDRLKKDGYNVDSYGYTKVADVAKDSKIEPRFSMGANKKQSSQIDNSSNVSIIIPKELIKGLDMMKYDHEKEYKQRVANHFNLNSNTLLTYDELMDTPKGDEKKWDVIVNPNEGDDAAFRPDVRNIYLSQH